MFGMGMVTVQQSGDTIINRLKAAKTLLPDGGMPAKIIEGLINGQGLQSLMQNPLSAIQSQLTGQISSAISQLTSAGGMGGLISALGGSGLQGAINGLATQASSLLGLGGSGVSGLMNTIAQGGLSSMLSESGLNMSSIGLDKVLGPVLSGTKLSEIANTLPTLVTRVLGGQVTQASAISTVNGHTAALNTITTASTTAMSTVSAAAADIGAANAVGAVIMDNTTDPLLKEALRISIKPEPLASIDAVQAATIKYMNEGRELLPKPEDRLNELRALEAYVASLNEPPPPPPPIYHPGSSGVG